MTEPCGCPGGQMIDFGQQEKEEQGFEGKLKSQLRQWPIQMHLISPVAPYFQGADVILAADCIPFSMGNFHRDYMKGKSIGIACPKLDDGQNVYQDKVVSWFEDAKINTLTVMIMQVPCCSGLVSLARSSLEKSARKVPVKVIVISLQGEVLQEDWITE